jgi:dipeptidyl aminopeptidase/acylaminoacyl peptidase
MKTLYLLICLVLAFSFTMHAQSRRALQPMDIFSIEYVSNPKISPDGTRIIYERNFLDAQTDEKYANLWIINSDGKEHRPLTTGNHRDFGAIWSKDQQTIFYRSNREGSVQIYKMWLDKGNIAKLSNLYGTPGGVCISKRRSMDCF